MKTIPKIFLWIWQLPQNLIGFFMSRFAKEIKIYKNRNGKEVKVYFTSNVFGCGISMGDYIMLDYSNYFFSSDMEWCYKSVLHEHGHQLQSKIFGPLYLIIIGITSAIFTNLWDRLFHKNWPATKRYKWYFTRFPENWADYTGHVNRWN